MLNVSDIIYPDFKHILFTIKGVRSSFKSENKSDSRYMDIGPNDKKLLQKLIESGASHRKFLRQWPISFKCTAPLYWWKQFDAYKIGTNCLSESTMHSIMKKPFHISSFINTNDMQINEDLDNVYTKENTKKIKEESIQKQMDNIEIIDNNGYSKEEYHLKRYIEDLQAICDILNKHRSNYLKFKTTNKTLAKICFENVISLLPCSYLQTRYISTNYEVLYNIFYQRNYHKLQEWQDFCEFILNVEYSDILFGIERKEDLEWSFL